MINVHVFTSESESISESEGVGREHAQRVRACGRGRSLCSSVIPTIRHHIYAPDKETYTIRDVAYIVYHIYLPYVIAWCMMVVVLHYWPDTSFNTNTSSASHRMFLQLQHNSKSRIYIRGYIFHCGIVVSVLANKYTCTNADSTRDDTQTYSHSGAQACMCMRKYVDSIRTCALKKWAKKITNTMLGRWTSRVPHGVHKCATRLAHRNRIIGTHQHHFLCPRQLIRTTALRSLVPLFSISLLVRIAPVLPPPRHPSQYTLR